MTELEEGETQSSNKTRPTQPRPERNPLSQKVAGPTGDPELSVEWALSNLRKVLAGVRGKCGRDFIRKLPQGKLLDALDAGRECGFPEDCL